MGVPGLTKALQPFGTTIDISASPQPRRAVIDGPALSHHMYHKLLAVQGEGRARNALQAMPSYAEVCSAVVSWLDALQGHGVTVAAIYFDGKLPEAKRNVRRARLEQNARQLVIFRSAFPDDLAQSTTAAARQLPASPFLVPATIETIRVSKFGAVLSLVPGEADEWCARDCRAEGGFALTSDSDLLLYDLGLHGSVVFFSDCEIETSSIVKVYRPLDIASRLNIVSLDRLGYVMSLERGKRLVHYVDLARGLRDDDEAYTAFKAPYQRGSGSNDDAAFDCVLDPRLSEFVHQSTSTHLGMYLPLLLEDPTRFSAWKCGMRFRTIAYSIVRLNYHPGTGAAYEKTKRGGSNISNVDVPLLSEAETRDSLRRLATDIDGWLHRLDLEYSPTFWRIIAGAFLLEDLQSLYQQTPGCSVLGKLLEFSTNDDRWMYFHYLACMQAELYSLRMLQQVLLLPPHLQDQPKGDMSVDQYVEDLIGRLVTLPHIRLLLDSGPEAASYEGYARLLLDHFHLEKTSSSTVGKHRAKKQQKPKQKQRTSPKRSAKDNNMFAPLSLD